MAAGLGAVFGTAAVMLSTFFNIKKKPELNQKETEQIEEKPMLAAVRPQSVGRCPPVAASSENVKPDKPSIGEQVKKETQQSSKCDETVSVAKVAEAEIMSVPDLSKIPQDESVVPIQPDVHFEAVTAIEDQIENQIVEAVKEIEKMVQVEKEEEEEEEEVEELCYPVKPATFSEQVLAAREIIESSPVVSPVPELTTEKEAVQVEEEEEEEEEEDEMVVVKAVATTEAAAPVKTEEIQTPESTKVAVPVKEEEISVPAVESEMIVNTSTVVEAASKEVAAPVKMEEIPVVKDSAAPDTAITAAITEASIPTEQPKSVEVEEEEEEEEEDEEDSMVILPSAVEVAKTQEPEKKVEEVKPTPIVTPAKEPEIKQEEEEEEYEDEEEEEEEVEEKVIAKTPVVAAVVEAPIIKKPETKAEEEEEEEYEEYEEDEEEEEKKDEKKKESNIQESTIRVAAEVPAVTAEVKPPTEPVKN